MMKPAIDPQGAQLESAPLHAHRALGFDALADAGFTLAAHVADHASLSDVVDQLPLPVYMTDAGGQITYVNREAAAFAGREPRIGQDRWCVTHRLFDQNGADLAHDQSPMAVALQERRPVRGVELFAERPDGVRVPFLPFPTPLFGLDGALIGGFNLLLDISDRKQAEQRIAHLIRHDALTGLHNRQAASLHLRRRIEQAGRDRDSFVVMRVDLDGFKGLNDEHGHAVGDAVLVATAKRLCATAGDAFLARIGGDEFMLISATDDAEPWTRAEQVKNAIAPEFVIDGLHISLTLSAGCARYPQDGDDEIKLVAAANAALHLAKAEGPGSVRMFDVAEQERERERTSLLRNLRKAIEAQEIGVHYQPLFKADGTVAGFEALARWRDPVRGIVEPSTFIPAAEEGGLIVALDDYVLLTACREAASWTQPLRISVNLSALEFESDGLLERVEAALAKTGLDPERLELEITEGVMVTDADRALATLSQLRALGVRIALDDFGTGYSSLSYLHRFPLTTLKIDRSFVAKLGFTLESVAITRAVIQLGHALGIEVVAEGVETPEQLDFLIQEGCDLTQGYLLGRPLPVQDYAHVTG